MDEQARIETMVAVCRERRWPEPLPEPLLADLGAYLAGRRPLTAITAHMPASWQPHLTDFPVPHPGTGPDGALDAIDLRLLDLCAGLGNAGLFFQHIAHNPGQVEQAHTHLRDQGAGTADILRYLLADNSYPQSDWFERGGEPSALGRLLQSYLPEHFAAMLHLRLSNQHQPVELAGLLVTMDPPQIDLAWQVATQDPDNAGDYVELLLPHDPARFTPWAREIAGPAGAGRPHERLLSLRTLLEQDPATHRDLALLAAREPLPQRAWDTVYLQETGLEALFKLDPAAAWPLIEEASLGSNDSFARFAVELLAKADFARARPALERCIAAGSVDTAQDALAVLREREWPGRRAYLLSLLAHRSKQIRDMAAEWLLAHDPNIVDDVAPLLAHRSADTRLTAVTILAGIGGERPHALLAARRDAEKAGQVRAAILDAVGLPAAGAVPAATPAAAAPRAAFLAEAEATMQRVKVPALGAATGPLPALCWADGTPVPALVPGYLLYRQSRVKEAAPDPAVAGFAALADRRAAAAWALALWTGWMAAGAPSKDAWALPLIGALGDDQLVGPMHRAINEWSESSRGAQSAKVVHALAAIGSDRALSEIDDIGNRIKHKQVVDAAQEAFAAAAIALGLTVDALADRVVPTLGLDAQGRQQFRYGPRTFTARLGADLELHLTDEQGKALPALPKPGKADDPDQAAAAGAAFKQLKAAVKGAVKVQTARIERALVTRRTWPVERWQALFLSHPLLRPLGSTLVWGLLAPDGGGYRQLFRPLEDGTLTGPDDNAVTLPATGEVRLVHPIELDSDVLAAWTRHLADYEVQPPFPQFTRPILQVAEGERRAHWWTPYEGYLMPGLALKGRYTKGDWRRGSVQDAGLYHNIWKSFPAAGIEAVLEITDLGVGMENDVQVALKRLAFVPTASRGSYPAFYDDREDDDNCTLPLGAVPPVVFSEAAGAVAGFAAAGAYDAEWERKAGY